MDKLIFSALVLFYLPLTAQAATEAEERQQVLKIMKQYIPLVACSNAFQGNSRQQDIEALRNIYTIEKDKISSIYYVSWVGDMGCAGGSATTFMFITEVAKYGLRTPLTIQNNYAFGQDIEINHRFIQSIKMISPSKFEIVSWDYADEKYGGVDGGTNFPANKFKYTIESSKFEPWKITNQALLEQNN